MKRTFTFLFAALLACVGVVKADSVWGITEMPTSSVEPASIETGYYLLKEVNSNATGKTHGYLRAVSEVGGATVNTKNVELNADNVDATYIWYVEKGEGVYTISTANKIAAWQAPWKGKTDLVAFADKAELVFTTEAITLGGHTATPQAGSFIIQDKGKMACVHYTNSDELGSWTDANPESVMMFEAYLVTVKTGTICDVTYEYYFNGEKFDEEIKQHLVGDDFAAPAKNFWTFSYATEGKVTAETTTVRVNCTENLPFAVTANLNNPVWQVVEMHRNGTFRVWQYDVDNAAVKVENYLGNKVGTVADNMLWCFVGNVVDGFSIYNKAAGMEKTLNATAGNASVGVAADGNNVWKLAKSTVTSEPAACFTNNGSSYMNQQGGKTAYHNAADNGSTCYFYNPADFVSEEVNAIKNIPAGVVGQYFPTAEVKAAFNAAVATFEADKTNIEACLALVGNIADVKASRKIEVAAGNYYIKATGNGNNANWYVTYNAANEFVAAALGAGEELSTKHVWTLETIEDEEGYKVKSAGLNTYVNALTAAAGKTLVTSDYAGGAKFTFTNNGFGKLIIKDGGNNVMRTENDGAINKWSGENDETWYLMPIVNEELLTNFCKAAKAFAALQDEVAFTALVEVSKKWNAANATAAPLLAAIEASEYVFEDEVEAAKQSMATAKAEIEPVLAYFNGDYKTASAKAKAFYGKLAEDSEAYTALAAAIATFEEVADVTTVEALEAKVAALNTVYDEQYAAYDLSEVIEEFSFQAEMFSYYGYDEDLKVFGGLHSTWNSVNSLNEQILEKITAGELVTKGEVEYAMERMGEVEPKIESILSYYSETYKPALDYAEAIKAKYEEGSDEYNALAEVLEAAKKLTFVYNVESLKNNLANLKANPVYALYDIDAPIVSGEEGWIDITSVEEGYPAIDNPYFATLERWVINQEIISGDESETLEGENAYNKHDAEWNVLEILPKAADMTGKKAVVSVKQEGYFDQGTYRLSGKAYHKGATNAVFFVGNTKVEIPAEEWITFENAPDKFWNNYTVEIEFEAQDGDMFLVGYGCEFESADAALYVSDMKLEKVAAVTTTLRKQFQEAYQGDMMMGLTGFSMLKEFEPYCFLEAMHPAYDVLFAEVDAICGAMWEGVPTDTATVAKAIRSMEAMKADFDAVANYLMTDEYWNTTQDALGAIEGYMEESDVYAQLMEAYNAAKGVVYYEEEVDGKIEVMAKYYATFTSVADIEDALEALANALEDAEAKIPTGITLNKDEVVLEGESTVQLTATVEGSETADKSVFWESDTEEVVTVDENGLVTVVGKIGGTYITAYSIHKSVYAECYVNVTALPTGIDGFEVKVETVIYDIHGRRVEKMEKGFYIVNGKKVLVK